MKKSAHQTIRKQLPRYLAGSGCAAVLTFCCSLQAVYDSQAQAISPVTGRMGSLKVEALNDELTFRSTQADDLHPLNQVMNDSGILNITVKYDRIILQPPPDQSVPQWVVYTPPLVISPTSTGCQAADQSHFVQLINWHTTDYLSEIIKATRSTIPSHRGMELTPLPRLRDSTYQYADKYWYSTEPVISPTATIKTTNDENPACAGLEFITSTIQGKIRETLTVYSRTDASGTTTNTFDYERKVPLSGSEQRESTSSAPASSTPADTTAQASETETTGITTATLAVKPTPGTKRKSEEDDIAARLPKKISKLRLDDDTELKAILCIINYLSPQELITLSKTCHYLRLHIDSQIIKASLKRYAYYYLGKLADTPIELRSDYYTVLIEAVGLTAESADPEPALIFGFMLSYFPGRHEYYPYRFFETLFNSLSPNQLIAVLYRMSEPPASRYMRYYTQKPLSRYLKEKKDVHQQLSDSELCKLIFVYGFDSFENPEYGQAIRLCFITRNLSSSYQLKDLALVSRVPDYTYFDYLGPEAIEKILEADNSQFKTISPGDFALMVEGAVINFEKPFAQELLVRIAEMILSESGSLRTHLFPFFTRASFPTLSRLANSFNKCSKSDNEGLNALAEKILEAISIEVCSYPDLHQWRSPYMSLAASALSDHPDNPRILLALTKITDHVAQFPPLGANGQTLFLLARGINQQAQAQEDNATADRALVNIAESVSGCRKLGKFNMRHTLLMPHVLIRVINKPQGRAVTTRLVKYFLRKTLTPKYVRWVFTPRHIALFINALGKINRDDPDIDKVFRRVAWLYRNKRSINEDFSIQTISLLLNRYAYFVKNKKRGYNFIHRLLEQLSRRFPDDDLANTPALALSQIAHGASVLESWNTFRLIKKIIVEIDRTGLADASTRSAVKLLLAIINHPVSSEMMPKKINALKIIYAKLPPEEIARLNPDVLKKLNEYLEMSFPDSDS